MKKYLSKTKGRYRQTSRSRWLLLAAAGLLVVAWLLPAVMSSVSAVVSYPAHVVRVWLLESNHSLSLYFQDKQELVDTVRDLEYQISQQSGTVRSIERLASENETLRSLLNHEQPDRIAARVLARPNQLPYDVMQIDRGSRSGVKVDAPVFYGVDQVIGFVFHVTPEYSLISLVTTPNQRATAYVLGPDIYTVTEGVGGGMLRVRLPQGVSVAEGDLVILPAVSSGVFGEIVHIETTPTQPQQYGYVSIPTPIQSLRYVSVGPDPITPVDFATVAQNVDVVRENLLRAAIPEDFLQSTTTATSTATATPPAIFESPEEEL